MKVLGGEHPVHPSKLFWGSLGHLAEGTQLYLWPCPKGAPSHLEPI